MELHLLIRVSILTFMWNNAYKDTRYFFYVVEQFLFYSELKGLGTPTLEQ